MEKIKSSLGLIAAFFLFITLTVNAFADPILCKLGNECLLSKDTVIVPVKKKLGTLYKCHLSLKNSEILIGFKSFGDFKFPFQRVELKQNQPEKDILILGTFNDEDGYINIDALGPGWAMVRCTAENSMD